MTATLALDAYIRVSKVAGRSGESFISPRIQRVRIDAWAQMNGAEVTWHEPELDVCGGTMRRPVFDRILERVRSGKTDGVIVTKLDRFARTLVGALGTLEEFERHNAVLVSVADNLDLSTPMGNAFLRSCWSSPSSSATGSASRGRRRPRTPSTAASTSRSSTPTHSPDGDSTMARKLRSSRHMQSYARARSALPLQ